MAGKTPQAARESAPPGTVFIDDVLAKNLRIYRLLRDMEQELVANRMVGLGHDKWRRVTVSEVERGRRKVTVPELVSLVVVLGATVEQLLDPRGPGGPRSAPPRPLMWWSHPNTSAEDASVDARQVTGLVCRHKVYAEPDWTQGYPRITYVDGRPDLTNVGPDGVSS